MVFNSLTFIVFFACVLALHALPLPWTAKKANLLVASYLFYAAWNPPFVILLWVSTIVDWYAALGLVRAQRPAARRAWMLLSVVVNLGMLERDLGMYQDAERDLEEVVERRLRLFGEEHFSTSNGLTNLARLRLDQGRYAEAESLYRRALAAMRATAGESHSGTADCLADVGRILEWEGKNEEAERFYRESIAVEQRVGQDQNAGISSTNAHLGRLLARTGRASEGEPLMREALATGWPAASSTVNDAYTQPGRSLKASLVMDF